jgi:O-antigen/teichoic acid export membrane protein
VTAADDPAAPPGADQAPGAADAADAARATTGRSVVSGGLWYLASYGIPQAYTVVISIVAARFLGPAGMGTQSFIAFVSISLTTVLSSSMYLALMRYIGESVGSGHSELVAGLLAWVWRIEAAAALVGGGALAAVAALGGKPAGAWGFAAVVCAAAILHTVPTAALIGLQRFRQAAAVGLVTGFVSTVAIPVVLALGGGITGMFAVEAVVGVANLAWTGTLARRAVRSAAPRRDAATRDLHRRVGRFALLSSLGLLLDFVVGTRSEFFFLASFSTHPAIAFYSIAYSAVTAIRVVPRALGGATAPAFATLYGAGAIDRIRSGYSRSLRLLLLVSILLAGLGFALAPALVRVVYGGSYAGVGGPLRILLAGFPLVALSSICGSLLAGLGRVRQPLIGNAAAAAVDIGLAAALIPLLDARGAAIANVAGEGTYSAIVLVFSSRLLGRLDWRPWAAARAVAVSAAAGAAGWATLGPLPESAGVVVGIAVALGVVVLLGAALKILPADDAQWIDESFGRRIGGAVGRLARLWAAPPGNRDSRAAARPGDGTERA